MPPKYCDESTCPFVCFYGCMRWLFQACFRGEFLQKLWVPRKFWEHGMRKYQERCLNHIGLYTLLFNNNENKLCVDKFDQAPPYACSGIQLRCLRVRIGGEAKPSCDSVVHMVSRWKLETFLGRDMLYALFVWAESYTRPSSWLLFCTRQCMAYLAAMSPGTRDQWWIVDELAVPCGRWLPNPYHYWHACGPATVIGHY